MHITRVYIDGFKRLTKFDLELDPTCNVIVGDNETGKSSVLEAIALVLTGQYDGRTIGYSLDPYLFNAGRVAEYFAKLQVGENACPPEILIEAYFDDEADNPDLAKLKGRNNTRSVDCPGLELKIEVHEDHIEALKEYAREKTNPAVLPVEFYKVTWRSFGSNGVALRNLPIRAKIIDTNLARIYRGPNKYVAQLANDILSEDQQRDLALAYRALRHKFSQEPGVVEINACLQNEGSLATNKTLTVQMDMSSRSAWESAISPHLDDLPLDCAGKGQQCRVQVRLAIANAKKKCQILLIEEPENHLSHSNLNVFMNEIGVDCVDRQIVVTTHSAFVLNKLGIDNLRLISHDGKTTPLTALRKSDTRDYFMKLPGFDTLRLILSRRCILVEGPSDELIVQRAYKEKHQKLPLEDGVDVISVRSLAFKRFLEIAVLLNLDVRVVTDNDGNIAAIKSKYADYLGGKTPTIKICYDADEAYPTLEPQLLKANSRVLLNNILGVDYADDASLLRYMTASENKTDCALRMFESDTTWKTPDYIANAIE
jgi:putative ATP-dependent endonuclease of the OLD family